jgi:hypothetical protein
MQRVSEVLQCPVIIERTRSLALELELSQEFDFLGRHVTAKRVILQEFCEPRLICFSATRRCLDEGKSFRFPGDEVFR